MRTKPARRSCNGIAVVKSELLLFSNGYSPMFSELCGLNMKGVTLVVIFNIVKCINATTRDIPHWQCEIQRANGCS